MPDGPSAALNGTARDWGDWITMQPLPEPVDGRSWCLRGDLMDTSERLADITVIERRKRWIRPPAGL